MKELRLLGLQVVVVGASLRWGHGACGRCGAATPWVAALASGALEKGISNRGQACWLLPGTGLATCATWRAALWAVCCMLTRPSGLWWSRRCACAAACCPAGRASHGEVRGG